ncbi:protein kinase domain-containing protein [Actinomadura gamaensis]|uniref:non-specific serine/threonine protein kinase n=1 Tax=Actinomadura gamaensis TaxID=1763541 RepID=A0ABV9U7S9_9ACTN
MPVYAGRELGGRYRLEERIGRGGMGEVWRASDRRLDRPVAVKVLPAATEAGPDVVARFRREAQLAAVLQHPGITVVHDIDADDGLLYLVMELLDGEDMARLLARHPAGLPLDRALGHAVQICGALAAAHARGIVHRDVKPANLFVTSAGWVKICDFGIARFMQSATGLTGSAVVGSPVFMAPEQISTGEIDGRTDLYALGCLLHQMLCGRPPFATDKGIPALINAHLSVAPTGPRAVNPQVPAEVDALVLELLAKDPADRPADADTVTRRLEALLGSDAPAAPVPSAPSGVPLAQEFRVAAEHLEQRRPELALALADHIVRERERILGAEHPAALDARHLLGNVLYELDREAEALPVLTAVAQARTRILGRHDPGTLASWHLVATSLFMLGRHADALPIAAGVLADREQALGTQDGATLESRSTLAWTLHMLDRDQEAMAVAQPLLQARAATLGEQHEDTLDTRQLIGWILLNLGQVAEAEAQAEYVHQVATHTLGPQAEAALQAAELLAACRSRSRARRRRR